MDDTEDAGFENQSFDPDDVMWVRGVDHLAGRRDATDAGRALVDALAAGGIVTTALTWQASSAADGAGRLGWSCQRLRLMTWLSWCGRSLDWARRAEPTGRTFGAALVAEWACRRPS